MISSAAAKDPYRYFRVEAEELVGRLTRGCLTLEKGTEPAADVLADLNRAAHSMKGAARLVELFDVGDAAHALEGQLTAIAECGDAIGQDQAAACLHQVDQIETLLQHALASTQPVAAPQQAKTAPPRIQEWTPAGPDAAASGMPSAAEESAADKQIRKAESAAPDTNHTTVATRDEPPLPRQQEMTADAAPALDLAVAPTGNAHASRAPTPADAANNQIARVSTDTLLSISQCAGELIELENRLDAWKHELRSMARGLTNVALLVERARTMDEMEHEQRNQRGTSACNAPLHEIDVKKLHLWANSVARALEDDLDRVGPLANRLHTNSLAARLVAVDEYAHRFEKVVRDSAYQIGRSVEFQLVGGEVKLDTQMLQALLEPLCHILRNAVAHGIESPAVRQEQNKAQSGTIKVVFLRGPEQIQILVEDDGCGIAPHLHHKIFEAGYSTREHLDQIAGRGIGLDAVKSALEQMRGAIELESEPCKYTRFRLTLPASIDVINVFAVEVGGQDFVFPLAEIDRTQIVNAQSVSKLSGNDAITIEDEPVALQSLAALTNIPSRPADGSTGLPVLVLRTGKRRLALVVDALKGKQRVVVKEPGGALRDNHLVSGVTVMPDGRPGFLLDVARLAAGSGAYVVATAVSAGNQIERTRSILIVDDSLTTRMLEKAILEGAGYDIAVGRNGVEALEILSRATFDMIITDLEMPGMDGLELAQQIRTYEQHADVPIVMLTSRGSDEDRHRGMEAGMQAYLVKGQFDQSKFLSTVRDIIGGPVG